MGARNGQLLFMAELPSVRVDTKSWRPHFLHMALAARIFADCRMIWGTLGQPRAHLRVSYRHYHHRNLGTGKLPKGPGGFVVQTVSGQVRRLGREHTGDTMLRSLIPPSIRRLACRAALMVRPAGFRVCSDPLIPVEG